MLDRELFQNYKTWDRQEHISTKANRILHSSFKPVEKWNDRRKLLEEHPHLRLYVNQNRLRKIIDYIEFKCSPMSSVARNMAIEGSDIDGALIVTNDPIPEADQLRVVEDLREQGFSVFAESEVKLIEDIAKKANAKASMVSFRTKAELDEVVHVQGRLNKNEHLIYAGGMPIPEPPPVLSRIN